MYEHNNGPSNRINFWTLYEWNNNISWILLSIITWKSDSKMNLEVEMVVTSAAELYRKIALPYENPMRLGSRLRGWGMSTSPKKIAGPSSMH